MILWRVIILWLVGVWVGSLYGLVKPSTVLANQQAQIRALFPQPSTGQAEWILVENIAQASAAAVLRDTHGSVKSHSFMLTPGTPWYQISATVSGITLNNDTDSVILSLNGQEVDTSLLYTSSVRDQVWTRLQSGWSWLSLQEFEQRWRSNDWVRQEPEASSSAAATGSAQILASPSAVFAEKSSPNEFVGISFEDTALVHQQIPYPGKKITLVENMSDAPLALKKTPPYFPEPDYEGEMQKYTEWLAWWQKSVWLWTASGVCWLTLGLPRIWKWVQKRRSRRLGWSLLS